MTWAVLQFPEPKVTDAGETVTSAGSAEVKSITTLPDLGFVSRATSKVSVVPDSLTLETPPDSVTVKAAVSTSEIVTATVRTVV